MPSLNPDDLKGLGLDHNLSQSADVQLRFAIANKRLIQFRYDGSLRVAEPHDYGIQNGRVRVFVYQLRGPVRFPPKSTVGWRLLNASKVEECIALEERFRGSRGQFHRRHLTWDFLYARVT